MKSTGRSFYSVLTVLFITGLLFAGAKELSKPQSQARPEVNKSTAVLQKEIRGPIGETVRKADTESRVEPVQEKGLESAVEPMGTSLRAGQARTQAPKASVQVKTAPAVSSNRVTKARADSDTPDRPAAPTVISEDETEIGQLKAKIDHGVYLNSAEKSRAEELSLSTTPNLAEPLNRPAPGSRDARAYVEIGTGTSTTGYVPFYGLYDYSWTQVIYLQSEIGVQENLTKISYNVSNTPSSYTVDNQKIFLYHTTDATFTSGTILDTTTMTKVFDGSVTWNGSGWHDIVFDNSFAYNNTDNLMVVWVNEDGSYVSGYPMWYYTNISDRCVYKYQDNTPIAPGDAGTVSYRAMNIRLHYSVTVPLLSTSTDSIGFGMVPPGMAVDEALTITNPGGAALNVSSIASDNTAFTVDVSSTTLDPDSSVAVTVTFNSPTPTREDVAGNLIITSNAASSPDTVKLTGSSAPTSGGPDTYGYTWANGYDAAGPIYSWIDTTGATNSGIAMGDDYRGTLDLPFSFYFYGNWYTQVTATTNGWMGMGPSTDYSSSYWTNYTIPTSSAPNNIIAPLWDDWKAGGTSYPEGAIYYKTVGTAPNRQFVVIFHNFYRYSSDTDWYTFEIILEEGTQNITFQYLDVNGSSSSANGGVGATVGIENGDGTDGLEYSYNGDPQLVYDGLAIQFTSPALPTEPIFQAVDTEVDFGNTGTLGLETIAEVRNNGGVDLNISAISFTNTDFSSNSLSLTVIPGQTSPIDVTYTPTAVAADTGYMVITHDGTTSPDSILLLGAGVDALFWQDFESWTASNGYSDPDPIGWSQTADAGAGGSDGKIWEKENSTYSFVYAGSYSTEFDGYEAVSGADSSFGAFITPEIDLTSGTSPGVTVAALQFYLKKRGTHVFTVDYTTDAGASWVTAYTTRMENYESGSGGWALVQIQVLVGGVYQFRFVGVADGGSTTSDVYVDEVSMVEVPPTAALTLDYDALMFFPSLIGEPIQELGFTVGSNTGAATLAVDSIVTTNPDFSVSMTTVRTDSVDPGGSVVVDLSFTAGSFGAAETDVLFYTNAPSSPDTMKISGEAGWFYVNFDDQMFPFGWTIIDNDTINAYGYDEGWNFYSSYGPGYGGYYARSHFNVDGADDWMITQKLSIVAGDSVIFYSNSSSSSILEDTLHVYVSTTDNAMSSFTTQIGEVLSEGYTNLRSAFDLSTWAGSDIYVAIVHHGSAGTNYWSYRKVDDVLLPARWLSSTPEVILSADSLGFGLNAPTMPATMILSIFNGGGVDLNITDITSDNTAFTVDVTSGTLAPFSSLDVNVTFTASSSGDFAGILSITSNAATSPDQVILTGSGAPTAGGPGGFGYTWINSFDPAGPAYAWIDTTDATAHNPNALGDDYRFDVTLPFSFYYYGNWVNSVVMTTNGWVGFDPSYTSSYWTNYSIPNTSNPNNMAAPLWDDWKARSATGYYHGILYSKTVGTAPNRQFALIWWEVVRNSSDTDYYSFEMVLDEATQSITFQYYDVDGSGNTGTNASNGVGATVGLEGPGGLVGIEYEYNGNPQLVYDGQAIRFDIPPMGNISGTVTDDATGAALEGVDVNVVGQNTLTDTNGEYSLGYIPLGQHLIEFSKAGYQSAVFTILVEEGIVTVQDAALLPAVAAPVYYSGFETGEDMGWTYTGGTNPFELSSGFSYIDGTDTTTVAPAEGTAFMVCTPNPGGYTNNEFSWWMNLTATDMDLSGYAAAWVTLKMWYMTESGWDFAILLANQPSVDGGTYYYLDVNGDGVGNSNDRFSGDSDGWLEITADLTPWAGLPDVELTVLFDADGSVIEGFGVAIDSIAVMASGTPLPPPTDVVATSFMDAQIPLTWTAPVGGPTAFTTVAVGRDQIAAPDSRDERNRLRRSETAAEVSFDYGEVSTRALQSYNVFRAGTGDPFFALIGNTTGTSFTDATVTNFAEYAYFVSTVYDEGESMGSLIVQAGAGAVTDSSLATASSDFEVALGTLPGGWTSIDFGPITWTVTDSSSAPNNIPAHTSFAYFDDDDPGSGVVGVSFLASPFMDLSGTSRAAMLMDYYFRGLGASSLSVWGRVGYDPWIFLGDLPATYPDWSDSVWLNISPVAGHSHVRIGILYDDADTWAWYAGVDNVEFLTFDGPTGLTAAPGSNQVTLSWNELGRSLEALPPVQDLEVRGVTREASLASGYSNRNECFNLSPSIYYFWTWGDSLSGPSSLFAFPSGPMTLDSVVYDVYLPDAPIVGNPVTMAVLVAETDAAGVTIDTVYSGEHTFTAEMYTNVLSVDLSGLVFNSDGTNFLKVTYRPLTWADSIGSGGTVPSFVPCPLSDDGNQSTGFSGWDSAGVFYASAYNFSMTICGTPPPPGAAYNVYRDDLMVAGGIEATSWIDPDAVFGVEHEYYVTGALPKNGPAGATVIIETDTSNHVVAGAENTAPAFGLLLMPANGDTLFITPANLSQAKLFSWTAASDPDVGQQITYHITWSDGLNIIDITDTTATAIFLAHQHLVDLMETAGVEQISGTWDVSASDGIATTPSTNGPFAYTIDAREVLGLEDGPALPEVFALHQNYPNPFNPITTIAYDVPELSNVKLEIYNVLGHKVRTLVNRSHQPGYYRVQWDGLNERGRAVSSGMYIYRIEARNFTAIRKLVIMK